MTDKQETNLAVSDSNSSVSDPKNKEIRLMKREMTVLIKENQKLQTELKTRNETINSLINQNFTELKLLQDKHLETIRILTDTYDTNIKNMNEKYRIFRSTLQHKLIDNLDTHYKFTNEKTNLLTNYQTDLLQKIDAATKDVNEKTNEIKRLQEIESQVQHTSQKNTLLAEQLEHYKTINQTYKITAIEYEKTINELSVEKNRLRTDLDTITNQYNLAEENMKRLVIENNNYKTASNDMYSKYTSSLNDNLNKQNNIDEKIFEIISLNSKISELEKKTVLLETSRSDATIKNAEFICHIDELKAQIVSQHKMIIQLQTEKETIEEEKNHHIEDAQLAKSTLREMELNLLEKIRQIQEVSAKEKENYIQLSETKLKDQQDVCTKKMDDLRQEYVSMIADKIRQIDGLTNHVKSFTENQYITLNENEKLKIVNEKFQAEQTNFNNKTAEIQTQCKKEMENLKLIHKKDKDVLLNSYNESINKAQDVNEALQTRLNQSIEALSLSKTTISNLKGSNKSLEQQISTFETETESKQEKYTDLKTENASLREKLERSIELNNTLSNREKQYDGQIKQLQAKCGQLISLTKKGMTT